MRDATKERWYDRVRLDDDDVIEEVKENLLVCGFSSYHIMVYEGEDSLVLNKGISSYLLRIDRNNMKLQLYKKDKMNLKKSDKFWLKREFEGDDVWWTSIKFIAGGKDI